MNKNPDENPTCLWIFINVDRQPSKKFLFVIARNKSSIFLGKKP
jgi:hypothetical protein